MAGEIQQNLSDYVTLLRESAGLTQKEVIDQMPQAGGEPIFSLKVLQKVEQGEIPESLVGFMSKNKPSDHEALLQELERIYEVTAQEEHVLHVLYGRRLLQARLSPMSQNRFQDTQVHQMLESKYSEMLEEEIIDRTRHVNAEKEIEALRQKIKGRRSGPSDENPHN